MTEPQAVAAQENWNAEHYRKQHTFVYESSRDLVSDWLTPQAGESILDLGCGTGELTNQLASSGAGVLGVDASQAMVKAAAEQWPQEGLEFAVQDAHHLPYKAEFDAVFSNAALHWMNPLDNVLAGVYRALKPGGRFALEMGGAGNVLGVRQAVEQAMQEEGITGVAHVWVFPTPAEFATQLEAAGFGIERLHRFARPTVLSGSTGFQEWLRGFGGSWLAPLSSEERQAVIARAQEIARPTLWNGNEWVADYVRLRVLAKK